MRSGCVRRNAARRVRWTRRNRGTSRGRSRQVRRRGTWTEHTQHLDGGLTVGGTLPPPEWSPMTRSGPLFALTLAVAALASQAPGSDPIADDVARWKRYLAQDTVTVGF